MARLFVAVWPPEPLIDELRHMDRAVRPGLRWTTEEQWHVTMRFLGGIDSTEEQSVRDGLAMVAARAGPLQAVAGPAPRRLGSGVWVLPVAGLDDLATKVHAATEGIGRPPGGRPFHGHLTLARAKRRGGLAGLPRVAMASEWTVGELTLVRSDLHPAGARYEVVGRWALVGPAPVPA